MLSLTASDTRSFPRENPTVQLVENERFPVTVRLVSGDLLVGKTAEDGSLGVIIRQKPCHYASTNEVCRL